MPQSCRKHKSRRVIIGPDAARRGPTRVPDGINEEKESRARRWRRDIVQARIRLADEGLSYAQRRELWQIVDCREWFLKTMVRDFHAELERIDREIEAALRR
jgi:hypothetical protein